METQHSGYLVFDTKKKYFRNQPFPSWLHTNWGSDIYLFGRLQKHEGKIRDLLAECNYYSCESNRDIKLARDYGYNGPVFKPFPNACGFDINLLDVLYPLTRTSERKIIMLKGYQGWSGRALVAITALSLLSSILEGYSIVIYSAERNEEILIASELLRHDKNLDVTVLNSHVTNQEMLEYFSHARLYIGLSISDGISTSMLEAMAMGVFPIQSDTSTASEWIVDSVSGFIVPPEDPVALAERIRIALDDDSLVDTAAEINRETIRQRADSDKIRTQIQEIYKSILSNQSNRLESCDE
jgi:glycosyltransferase involved in cell wall biosynthesis